MSNSFMVIYNAANPRKYPQAKEIAKSHVIIDKSIYFAMIWNSTAIIASKKIIKIHKNHYKNTIYLN